MAKKKGEEDAKRLRMYMDRIEAAEKWRDNAYKVKWERFYKRWRNYVDALVDRQGKPITDRSNISIPYTFTMLETVLPRLVETLFAGRPYVTIKARTREWENNAKSMQTLVDYQHNEVMDIQDIFHTGLKIMALYGTSVAYVGWKYKERGIIKKELAPVMLEDQPMMEDDGVTPVQDYQPVKKFEVEYDDPEIRFLDLGLFYVDPNATDIDDARYAGHSCFKSKDELEEMEALGTIEKLDWKKIPNTSVQNNVRNDRMGAVGIPSVDNQQLDPDKNSLYECHYYYEDDKCVFIINRGYIAKDEANPFWHKRKPYVKDTYTKVPNEFYGIGVVEVIEDQQDELNTERNMRIDYRSHNLRRMFLVRKGAEINRNQLVWKQNGIIEVDNLDNSIKVLDPPSIQGDTFNQEEIVKQDMRDAIGAHDVVMGAGSSGGTATETMSKDNNASMRFKLIISSIEKRLLVGVVRLQMQLNQQFVDDVRILPLFDEKGDDWPKISPEQIQGEFHLTASGSSVEPMANKEAFKQRMVELYSLASSDPLLANAPIQRRNLLKKVFEAFDISDTEELLPSDEELTGMVNDQAVQGFIAGLPPELQQLLQQFMAPPMTAGPPQQIGGGANTAPMQEQGLQLVKGGG